MQDFKTIITVNASPQHSFESINDVTKWWTENLEGSTHKQGDEFTVQFGDIHYSKQRIAELIPGKKVAWMVIDSNLSFVANKQEWTNTMIVFDISIHESKTQIHFTHDGLIPAHECFDACSNAWSQYIQQSLLSLVNTGEGQPTRKEIPIQS
jgi:hypothetical protein